MIANIHPKTGVAYGVVSLHSLADWVFDEFFYNGRNITIEAALEEWKLENPEGDEQEFYDNCEFDEEEYELEVDGMKLGLSYLGGAPLVWIFESPHIAQASVCSPCVPNAGDLDNQRTGGIDCYTLPEEWFQR